MINAFLASICELERSGLDDVQSEFVTAVLEVLFVTDKFGRPAYNSANAARAQRKVSDVNSRAPPL
jgi:hypothetical protein